MSFSDQTVLYLANLARATLGAGTRGTCGEGDEGDEGGVQLDCLLSPLTSRAAVIQTRFCRSLNGASHISPFFISFHPDKMTLNSPFAPCPEPPPPHRNEEYACSSTTQKMATEESPLLEEVGEVVDVDVKKHEAVYSRFTPARKRVIVALIALAGLMPRTFALCPTSRLV